MNWAGTSFASPAGYAVYQGLDAVQLITVVPEPTTLTFLVSAAMLLLAHRRRR